jgi:hypothetical protein
MVYKESEKKKFAVEVLKGIGAPTSQANVDMLIRWMEAEDSRSKQQAGSQVPVGIERFNPLNTTRNAPGSTSVNDVGVKAYSDFATGVRATVDTLRLNYYTGVVDQLKSGSGGWEQLRSTIGASPWGTFKQFAGTSKEQAGQLLEVTKKMIARAALVDPEIQKLLRDFKNSGKQGPDAEAELELAIENSKWARSVSDRVRATVGSTLKMDEPTYQEKRRKEVERIKSLATIYGAEFDEATLNNLADNTLLLGWSDEELRDALIGTVGFGPAYVKGLAGTTSQRLIQGIRDNGFDMSTSSPEFINYVKESIRLGGPESAAGSNYLNDVIGNFRNQAAQLYPQFRNRFEQGANLSDVLSPYRTIAASMLEVPFESIGLQDDLMKQVLQAGETLNSFDFGKMVKKSPAWQYTSNAWDTILGTLEGVLEDFGFKF